jgi:hypothetical protein|tara:strand:+ start:1184 stop:1363 length:180 start_codon:yes stop_codon:yes gene_type:complete
LRTRERREISPFSTTKTGESGNLPHLCFVVTLQKKRKERERETNNKQVEEEDDDDELQQ